MATLWWWIGRHKTVSTVLGALVALVVVAALADPSAEPERPVVYVDEYGDVLSFSGDGDAGVELEDAEGSAGPDAAATPQPVVDQDAEPVPKPVPKPGPKPRGGGCAPGYRPCIPHFPPDLDCGDTGPVTVSGADPHGLDGDGDGKACGGD